MSLVAELKRKAFHHLSLIYLLVYAFTPIWVSTTLFGVVLILFWPEWSLYVFDGRK